MKNKWIKRLVTFGFAAAMMFTSSFPAFAFVDSSQSTETAVLEEQFTGDEAGTNTGSTSSSVTGSSGTAGNSTSGSSTTGNSASDNSTTATSSTTSDTFSVEGNGTVLDNVADASGKEFYTIQTANNSTYFMVIDHSGTSQNVYMLSMIDENDLENFLSEESEDTATWMQPSVVLEEDSTESDQQVEVDETVKADDSAKSGSFGTLALLGIIGAGIVGGYYYLKIYKPKKDGGFSDDEDLEYLDDGETINEDEENTSSDDDAYDEEED